MEKTLSFEGQNFRLLKVDEFKGMKIVGMRRIIKGDGEFRFFILRNGGEKRIKLLLIDESGLRCTYKMVFNNENPESTEKDIDDTIKFIENGYLDHASKDWHDKAFKRGKEAGQLFWEPIR